MLCFLLKIENDAHYAKVTKQADADFYFAQKTAEANKVCVCERERESVCERVCLACTSISRSRQMIKTLPL